MLRYQLHKNPWVSQIFHKVDISEYAGKFSFGIQGGVEMNGGEIVAGKIGRGKLVVGKIGRREN